MEENVDSDESHKKTHHFNSMSSDMARHSLHSPPDNTTVDAAALQSQNQRLVQQLDVQKHELKHLEDQINELNDRQSFYDDKLITLNKLWNQLQDDLILFGVHAGGGQNAIKKMDQMDCLRGSIPSCPAEDIFLCRCLGVDCIERSSLDRVMKFVQEAIALRQSSTHELIKFFKDTIDGQAQKIEGMVQDLPEQFSVEEAVNQLSKVDNFLKEEANNLNEVINSLYLKHKEYADRIQTYLNNSSVDKAEIHRLTGELEETMAELEESRRKLVNLKVQKDIASGSQTWALNAVSESLSPEKTLDRGTGLQELKDSIEEAKTLAVDRLSQIQDARADIENLTKQLQDLQNELKDDKYVHSSRPFVMLNDMLRHWNSEVERYKALTDSLQADRFHVIRREKELEMKIESVVVAQNSVENSEFRIPELELQLQQCIVEKNDHEMKVEEIIQDSGRKDIKEEFLVMNSALTREMKMMKSQLSRWKNTADESNSLRKEVQSFNDLLNKKEVERKSLTITCDHQMVEIKLLKSLIEKLQKQKLELQTFLDMHGQESYDSRDLTEIKESEHKAHLQTEVLKCALDEHSLELRVKAANEAEAACQQRLSVAEVEIADLCAKLDTYERDFLVVTEAIKIKDVEAESYISEIETIGQAYEDMLSQNQRLLQQLAERDEYNIKLVSESVKAKQSQSSLFSEKQALMMQLQQVNSSIDSLRKKIICGDGKMKALVTEGLNSTEEDRHYVVSLETLKWELSDAEKELKWIKSASSSSEKEHHHIQRKIDDIQIKLDIERSERMKVEEEVGALNSEIAHLSSQVGEAAIQKLQSDIKDCKGALKCGVCFDRPKEVVIVKCYHLFCNPCIQRNLEIRHRKCPACGTAFGQNDVRFVKI